MKRFSIAIVLLATGATGLTGCSLFHRHHKSTFKIIQEGDSNPFIHEDASGAGQEQPTVEVRKF